MPKRRLVLCLLSLSFLRPGWLGLIVLPGFSPAFKRGCNRCVWLFKRPGRMGYTFSMEGGPCKGKRDILGGSAPGCSFHCPQGVTLLLARFVLLEVFPSTPGIHPVIRSIPCPAGAVGEGTTVEKNAFPLSGGWSED